ncbi:MAG: CBS domain-containing protein [Rhodospirillales bacterium]|nr:CBS domain-containing protein [Rhodospirillales bacterium]
MPITAADIMTREIVTISPTTRVGEVARILSERRVSALPVCDENGHLVGIVSEGDVLRPLRESLASKRAEWLLALAEGENLSPEFLDSISADTRSAADIMIRHVITAEEGAELPHLAELMIRYNVKRLPVMSGAKLVGIVSRADLIKALARAPHATWLEA